MKLARGVKTKRISSARRKEMQRNNLGWSPRPIAYDGEIPIYSQRRRRE